jgi:hypothetical protein
MIATIVDRNFPKFSHFRIKVGHGKVTADYNDFPSFAVGAELVAVATIIVYTIYGLINQNF